MELGYYFDAAPLHCFDINNPNNNATAFLGVLNGGGGGGGGGPPMFYEATPTIWSQYSSGVSCGVEGGGGGYSTYGTGGRDLLMVSEGEIEVDGKKRKRGGGGIRRRREEEEGEGSSLKNEKKRRERLSNKYQLLKALIPNLTRVLMLIHMFNL